MFPGNPNPFLQATPGKVVLKLFWKTAGGVERRSASMTQTWPTGHVLILG